MTYKTVPAWSKGNRGRRRPARSSSQPPADVEALLARADLSRTIARRAR